MLPSFTLVAVSARNRFARLGRCFGAAAGWALVPVVLCFFAVVLYQGLEPEWRASRGEGVRGTFTAGERSCSYTRGGPVCSWSGSFISDDAVIRFSDVLSDDDPSHWVPGSTDTAVWEGELDAVVVYRPGDGSALAFDLGLGLTAVLGLAVWLVAVTHRLTGREYPAWIEVLQGLLAWPPPGPEEGSSSAQPSPRPRRAL